MPLYKKVNKDFFKVWTHEMAYVLGFFSADGYITVNKRGGHFWSIQITDKELLEDIRITVDSDHRIGIRPGKKKGEKIQYRLQVGSIEMCNDLRKLGLQEAKTYSMAVPKVPDKYLGDFVRGYFDGDGNVWVGYLHKNRPVPLLSLQVMFTSCSVKFLEDLLRRVRPAIVSGGSIYRSKHNYARLQFGTKDSLKLYDFMYNHRVPGKKYLFLNRKRRVFERFIKMRS